MPAQPAKPPAANDDDLLDEGIDEILAEHSGDARAAIRALLAQISYLGLARNRAVALASYGYARGEAAMSKARGTAHRRDMPRDPAAVLRLCRAFNIELAKIQADVMIQGPIYQAISAIGSKIDGLAELLTGEQGYFSRGYASNTSQPAVLEKWRKWDAIEKGDEPWPK
jgi:hypothetical protein